MLVLVRSREAVQNPRHDSRATAHGLLKIFVAFLSGTIAPVVRHFEHTQLDRGRVAKS